MIQFVVQTGEELEVQENIEVWMDVYLLRRVPYQTHVVSYVDFDLVYAQVSVTEAEKVCLVLKGEYEEGLQEIFAGIVIMISSERDINPVHLKVKKEVIKIDLPLSMKAHMTAYNVMDDERTVCCVHTSLGSSNRGVLR